MTLCICVASSRVGDIMSAPNSLLARGSDLRDSFSRIGMTNASVLPDPVTASTTTSLFCIKSGITLDCTGAIDAKPMTERVSRLK